LGKIAHIGVQETSMTQEWPDLSQLDLPPTIDALHLWSQAVGKVRLSLTPWTNHSWHVPLYVSARGLSTGLIAARPHAFEMEFDLTGDVLVIRDTGGQEKHIALAPQSVAHFYAELMQALEEMGLAIRIDPQPCELPDALPFHDDHAVRVYDGHVARAWWRALVHSQRVFHLFRTRFLGKCSPIHLFWGSFDLAVTRFSGRKAPPHPGGAPHMPDAVARDAYNQELSSAGFWPGGKMGPHYYSYAYPTPPGFAQASILPDVARFDEQLGEFLLSYEAVRTSADPDAMLLAFLQTTYEAAADLAHWDRQFLEGPTGPVGHPPDGI
jgi:hypothetical protein